MPSQPDALRRTLRSVPLICAISLLAAAPAFAAQTPAQSTAAAGGRPTEADLKRAIEILQKDPNLGGERKIRTLKWAGRNQKSEADDSANLGWLIGFFSWLATAGRLLLWVGGALLILLLATYLTRFLRSRDPRIKQDRHVAPTHVRDLDIRPESLPADIGAAADSLWERGEHRAALALLYRGLLSRLAHVHAVPIRDSSTEGECLILAGQHLEERRATYVSQLIRVWQRAVYGGVDPEAEVVGSLCAGFSAALNAPPRAQHLTAQPA